MFPKNQEIIAELESICSDLVTVEETLTDGSVASRTLSDAIDALTEVIGYLESVNPNDGTNPHAAIEISGWIRLVLEALHQL